MNEQKNKGYWKDGYFYVENEVICGICSRFMGISTKQEGELSYCGCEEYNSISNYLNR